MGRPHESSLTPPSGCTAGAGRIARRRPTIRPTPLEGVEPGDPANEAIMSDDEANRIRLRAMREPWHG